MGAASSASALAIPSRRVLTSSSGICSMKSATTSLLTIPGHLGELQIICLRSYDMPLFGQRRQCCVQSGPALPCLPIFREFTIYMTKAEIARLKDELAADYERKLEAIELVEEMLN